MAGVLLLTVVWMRLPLSAETEAEAPSAVNSNNAPTGIRLTPDSVSLRQARTETVVVTERARKLHQSCLLFDGHNDLPWQVRERGLPSFTSFDIRQRMVDTHTDIPRLREGGVGAQFWSVYVPASTADDGTALRTTLEQMDVVKRMIEAYPDTFELALTAADVERIHATGKIASLMGMEGGHSIENSINVLRQLYQKGARYMTLTHSATLDWADSATDDARHDGLTPFGEEVVREMNRLGMLVDLSHVSIATMVDAIELSQAPVIFSHSSARSIADHPRNVPDDVLRMVTNNGGVVLVNFYPGFVVPETAKLGGEQSRLRKQWQADGLSDEQINVETRRWKANHPMSRGTIHDVVDHIEHICRIAGVDHVGLGSDYDGIDMVPAQLDDVSTYPRITQALLDRGFSDDDVRKILGANLLRVMYAAEQVAEGQR